jgi:hypothetical protein
MVVLKIILVIVRLYIRKNKPNPLVSMEISWICKSCKNKAKISWINPLDSSFTFLGLEFVISPIDICNESFGVV